MIKLVELRDFQKKCIWIHICMVCIFDANHPNVKFLFPNFFSKPFYIPVSIWRISASLIVNEVKTVANVFFKKIHEYKVCILGIIDVLVNQKNDSWMFCTVFGKCIKVNWWWLLTELMMCNAGFWSQIGRKEDPASTASLALLRWATFQRDFLKTTRQ